MDKYLLEILKDNNTIIIPGLGALTITNKDTGETMFMPYLQHDDGKLAAFIAQNDGMDEGDAKNMVAKYVREIKAQLDKGESYSMFQLGTFVKTDGGDVEFQDWTKSAEKEEEIPAPVAAAPIIEETVIADEPTVEDIPETVIEPEVVPEPPVVEPVVVSEPEPTPEPEPVVEPEPIVEAEIVPEVAVEPEPPIVEPVPEPAVEAEVAPEVVEEPGPIPTPEPPVVEPVAVSAPEPTPEPEPVVESTPVITPEPTIEPEPISATDPIEITPEEVEIRETIVDAIKSAPIIDEMIPEKTTLEPSPLLDDIAPTKAIPHDLGFEGDDNTEGIEGEEEDEKKKDKAGAGFWILMILIALGIIAGGAYVGRNYNDLKQHVPFLADNDEEEKKSLKDEISNVIKEDKYSVKPDKSEGYDGSSNSGEEESMEEGQEEGSSETMEVVTPPEPEVITPEVTPPTSVNVATSAGGPFKVVAGAFSSEANANRLAAEFKAKGLNSEVFMKGELYAVSMQSYPTTEAANADLAKLKSMAPGAWIFYKQ